MIHVCFGLHDKTGRYSKFTGTAIRSLFANTISEVTVHILHDNTLSQENREKFVYLTGQFSQRVKFYNVEELCKNKLNAIKAILPEKFDETFTVAAMYRFLIPQLLAPDVDKAIYLDSDTVINIDVKELWQIELNDKPLGAVAEASADSFSYKSNAATNPLTVNGIVSYDDYFNSGVLLMNLKFLRDEAEILFRGMKFIAEQPQIGYIDQDVFNYLFSKTYLKLPVSFDFFVREARQLSETPTRRIYHFAGDELKMNTDDPFNRLWMDNFVKTPWFDSQTFGRLYAKFSKSQVDLLSAMINLSALMSGKTRIFCILQEYLDLITEKF
ncbi:MAG: glycosyltransferase family 8 protein, partial [Selenomonadaceae bacterium]|nr:glycosyltransferase family 8 protein [Selenomonadaceae bacterium]